MTRGNCCIPLASSPLSLSHQDFSIFFFFFFAYFVIAAIGLPIQHGNNILITCQMFASQTAKMHVLLSSLPPAKVTFLEIKEPTCCAGVPSILWRATGGSLICALPWWGPLSFVMGPHSFHTQGHLSSYGIRLQRAW